MVSSAAAEVEFEVDRTAGQAAQKQPLGESCEHAPQHEGKGFEDFDRVFEVNRFAQTRVPGFGQRRFDLEALGSGDQLQDA